MGDPAPAALDTFLRRAARSAAAATEAEAVVRADAVTQVLGELGLGADPAERLRLFAGAADLCPKVTLEVAGYDVEARLTPAELWRFYLPLCQAIRQVGHRAGRRILVGVGGPGASGKSVLALLLIELLNRWPDAAARRAALCTLDGFHFPNSYLDSHFTTDAAGRRVPLRAVKGSPDSFDAASFVAALRRLRSEPAVSLPRYDRRLHDPVPDGHPVGPEDGIVLVEGNYLLLDRDHWADVAGLLDLCLFISLPMEAAREAMVPRFVRGGRPAEEARRRYDAVDRANYEVIVSTMPRADLVIRRDARQRIIAIERPAGAV